MAGFSWRPYQHLPLQGKKRWEEKKIYVLEKKIQTKKKTTNKLPKPDY